MHKYIFTLLLLSSLPLYAAENVGTAWGFWGDSQTFGVAPTGSCKSSPEAIWNVWDGSPTTYKQGIGGRILTTTGTAYDSYSSKSGLTWVHFQDSGGQDNGDQSINTATKFGNEFDIAMKNIAADSPNAVISYETAFSFGREAKSDRDWDSYNTELLSRVKDLETNEGITVIIADVNKYIKLLQAEKTPGDVWYQDGHQYKFHYTALGNFMVALTVWDALGYDVSTMDLSGVTDVTANDKNTCIALFTPGITPTSGLLELGPRIYLMVRISVMVAMKFLRNSTTLKVGH